MTTLKNETTRTGVTRRSLVAGAAWSVPAVAMASAAPAFAVSGVCIPFAVGAKWNSAGYKRTNDSSAKYTINVNNPVTNQLVPVTVTISSTLTGETKYGGSDTASDNLKLSGFNIGGSGAPGITLHQYRVSAGAPRRNHYQSVKFSFNVPVYDLAFGITDIDSNSNDFYDHVELVSPATWTYTTGTTVTGAGTASNPWRNTSSSNSVDNASGIGNANITFTQPVQEFTIIYWDNRTSSSNWIDPDQKIFITDLGFKISGCDFPK